MVRWTRGVVMAVALGMGSNAWAARFVTLEGPLDPAGTAEDHVMPAQITPDMPYAASTYRGASQLKLSRDFVEHVAQGLELVYARKFADCRTFFAELEAVFPDTAVSPIADMLIWQSLMLENFDYRYEDQYRAASKLAQTKLDAAKKKPGNEGWEALASAVVVGIDAIHMARKQKYMPALTLAFEAIDHVEAARAKAPEFIDIQLADGLYNYWRTRITQNVKALPDFGDKKEEGIAQMQRVIDQGVFLVPPARLAMSFTWMEERKYAKASGELEDNFARYPDNIINTLMLGISKLREGDADAALAKFDHILVTDPNNRRAHYYRGVALMRMNKLDEAEKVLRHYLSLDYIESWQQGSALYYLGRILAETDREDEAAEAWKEAVKVAKDPGSKRELDKLKKKKK